MKFAHVLLAALLLLVLSACGSGAAPAAEALPTVVLEDQGSTNPVNVSGSVTASGFVIASQEAQLAFATAGSVGKVNVQVGDVVQAGDILAELDNDAIQLELDQAERNLREITSPAAIASAAQAVANAQKALEEIQDDAEGMFYPRASDTLIDNTQGEIDLARQALTRATDAYRLVARRPDGDSRKAAALVAMTDAQLYLNSLIAKYNWYAGTPTATDAALVQANLEAAKVGLQEAQWYLAALKGEQLPPEATGGRLAQLEAARDVVTGIQDRLENTRLIAPISGTVTTASLIAGEYASPGQVVFVISDVANLLVETTDLSERDVPSVEIGQPVSVSVDALGQTLAGKVIKISPVADTLGGDVVYKTTIELIDPPAGLRSGMSVEVRYGSE